MVKAQSTSLNYSNIIFTIGTSAYNCYFVSAHQSDCTANFAGNSAGPESVKVIDNEAYQALSGDEKSNWQPLIQNAGQSIDFPSFPSEQSSMLASLLSAFYQQKKLPVAAVVPAKEVFLQDLSRGMRGPEVKELQNVLIAKGLLRKNLNTGYFGSYTEQALRNFQKQSSLAVTGRFDGATRQIIQ
jgi:hypothetical protein